MERALSQRYQESPLATLVRRTSSKRLKKQIPSRLQQTGSATPPTITLTEEDEEEPYQEAVFRGQFTQPLPSPLLHGHFGRDSVASASSFGGNSLLESSSHGSRVQSYSSTAYPESELEYYYGDDAYEHSAYEESIYTDDMTGAVRDSWHSNEAVSQSDPRRFTIETNHDMRMDRNQAWADNNVPPSPTLAIPAVVVSSPDGGEPAEPTPLTGRARVVHPSSVNYSRPHISARPPPVDNLEEQKRQVLLRNAGRRKGQSSSTAPKKDPSPSPLRNQYAADTGPTAPSSPRDAQTDWDPQAYSPPFQHTTPQSQLPTPPSTTSTTNSTFSMNRSEQSLSPQGLGSNSMRDRAVSAASSLYSNYSYYPYENAAPSPTGSGFGNSIDARLNASSPKPSSNFSRSTLALQTSLDPRNAVSTGSEGESVARKYLLLGIEHHEHDRLKESAACFERSAKEGGGCGVGMLMWGLTLRHGWGCEKNEKMAFKWLQKAAESAVDDLEATRTHGIKNASAVQSELVLAIYEVGQCFFQGWGVPKDKKMAVSYYTMAAELGDADAQVDLAFCLTNGKGCKQDKRQAAKWYRAAVKQGQSDVGLAWIYKDKYQ
ncbi:hypothetical protein FA15DRAFT_709552 [Coprinopsis marcescibilis]|uniref:HCP-like protein n=1 Tax=Coprinopsis marcescibilis TaxID=230819 RepID=A0A5C3KF81_COPMA|nr:hypothetical protein FA15DRAFT_709552 [Coprinopsis marcescibilis]